MPYQDEDRYREYLKSHEERVIHNLSGPDKSYLNVATHAIKALYWELKLKGANMNFENVRRIMETTINNMEKYDKEEFGDGQTKA